MPYDSAQPADHSDLSSEVMRNQLNALNEKIDATPTITAAQVDVVNTVAAVLAAVAGWLLLRGKGKGRKL